MPGGASRGRSAGADATTTRAAPVASACRARGAGRGDAEVRRQPAIRIDLQRRKRQHRALDDGVATAPSSAPRKNATSPTAASTSASVGHDEQDRRAFAAMRRRGHGQRLCAAGVSAADALDGGTSPSASTARQQQRLQRE